MVSEASFLPKMGVSILSAALRIGLAILLAVTAIAKWVDFLAFEDSMRLSQLFPFSWRHIIADGIIGLELLLGASLVLQWRKTWPLQAATMLGGLFLGYAVWRFRMGIPSPCHCLGFLAELGPVQSIEFALSFFAASAVALLLSTATRRPQMAKGRNK